MTGVAVCWNGGDRGCGARRYHGQHAAQGAGHVQGPVLPDGGLLGSARDIDAVGHGVSARFDDGDLIGTDVGDIDRPVWSGADPVGGSPTSREWS